MQGPVQFFLELMFMFGSYFDTDLQHPWVDQVLENPLFSEELFRAGALHQNMTDYLDKVSGPGNQYAKEALRKTRLLALEPVAQDPEHLRSELLEQFDQAYAEKCTWLGKERVGAIIDRATQIARANAVTTTRGMRVFAVLAFALGHGFADDPLYPWISNTLAPSDVHPNVRVERLEAKPSSIWTTCWNT
jgi:hypothetical protein